MSIKKHSYVMVGIRRTMDDLNLKDDKLLPYIEGHASYKIGILYGEGNDYIYIGQVVARGEPYTDEASQTISFPSRIEIAALIQEAININIVISDVENWFFELYH